MTRRLSLLWLIAISVFLSYAGSQVTYAQEGRKLKIYAIVDITIVDVEKGELRTGQTVIIDGNKIRAIGTSDTISLPEGTEIIKGKGLYMLPGLIDAHVHYVDPPTYGPLFISQGVLFVRDMGGFTGRCLRNRDALNQGIMLGPEMITTGAVLDGYPECWPFSEICTTPEEARANVQKLSRLGVNQIKVYTTLGREEYLAILDEAKKLDLKVVGHIPECVTVDEAIHAGHACGEHLYGLDLKIARLAGMKIDGEAALGFLIPGLWKGLERIDHCDLDRFIAVMKNSGVVWDPTLTAMERTGRLNDETMMKDPLIAYVPSFLQVSWKPSKGAIPEELCKASRDNFKYMKDFVKKMYDAGIPLMCGTDVAVPYVVPGFSLHEEMRLFQECGVPPAAVLQSATIVPARFCGVADRLGTIEEGKSASIVLVKENPLTDVRHAEEISGVFIGGRYFDHYKLEALLSEVRRYVAANKPGPLLSEVSLPGRVILKGSYRVKWLGKDVGKENFTMTETPEGYHFNSHSLIEEGFYPPSQVIVATDRAFRVYDLEWLHQSQVPLRAKYRLKGNLLKAEASQEGFARESMEIEVPESFFMAGPALTLDHLLIKFLNLEEGCKKDLQVLLPGYGRWNSDIYEGIFKREKDTAIELMPGEKVVAEHHMFEIKTSMGFLSGEIFSSHGGKVLKSVRRILCSEIEATLEK